MTLPETNLVDLRRYKDPRFDRAAQSVDVTEWLGRAASRLWAPLVVFTGIGVLFIAMRIFEAFMSGRVAQILDAITRAR